MLKILPQEEAIVDSMDSAKNSIEAAEYLLERLKKIFAEQKVSDKFGDLIKVIENFAKLTRHKLTSANQSWLGETAAVSDFKNMQANLAKEAADTLYKLLKQTSEAISLDFAISQDSKFVRGYSANGNGVDAETTGALDKLFNAWLVANNMTNKGGVLYEINTDGQIKMDEETQVKVNPEKLDALITEPNKGFIQYLESQGIKAIGNRQEFPGAEPENRTSIKGGQQ